MSAVYPSARTAFLSGAINLLTDTVKVRLVGAYAYSEAHDRLDDLTATVGAPALVAVTAIVAGEVIVNPVTFPLVTDGAAVSALVAYRDSGSPATSHLLAHIDRRGDTVPLAFEGTGGDVTFNFDYLLKL